MIWWHKLLIGLSALIVFAGVLKAYLFLRAEADAMTEDDRRANRQWRDTDPGEWL